jgi:DNA polymerase-1
MSSEEEAPNLTVHLFMNAVFSYVNQFKPDKIYAAWDKKLLYPSDNFRKQLIPNTYKANRDKSLTVDAHIHEEKLSELLKSIGICNIFPYKLEADDVISFLAQGFASKGNKATIVSSDKDFLQIVSENIHVYSPIKKIKSPFCLKSSVIIFSLSGTIPIIPIVGVGNTGTSFPPMEV